ncbi:MAG TPA: hypothetical protein VL027_12800 [Spongiibacteraceae bacterium]|jgi:hypothetical protein|nr:hypothetical protein [Spongiibacteraceae bacterium]HUH38814.1 hypothetical protein [Spongiibacteraceae bacterium]
MEKIIYLLGREAGADMTACRDWLINAAVPAALQAGAYSVVLNVADIDEPVRAESPQRIAGSWEQLGGALHLWFDTLEARAPVEAMLEDRLPWVHGYLVTESIPQKCERSWKSGERRPGVTQFTAHAKPENIDDAEFYHNWQVRHSAISFQLHPLRWSYERNAVARIMTPGAPPHRSIVLEHFRELRDFTDEGRYFGEQSVVEEMFAELAGFCDVSTMLTGPMSEYVFERDA